MDQLSQETLISYFDQFLNLALFKEINEQQLDKVKNEWLYFKGLLFSSSYEPHRMNIYFNILKQSQPLSTNSYYPTQENDSNKIQTSPIITTNNTLPIPSVTSISTNIKKSPSFSSIQQILPTEETELYISSQKTISPVLKLPSLTAGTPLLGQASFRSSSNNGAQAFMIGSKSPYCEEESQKQIGGTLNVNNQQSGSNGNSITEQEIKIGEEQNKRTPVQIIRKSQIDSRLHLGEEQQKQKSFASVKQKQIIKENNKYFVQEAINFQWTISILERQDQTKLIKYS